VTVVVGIDPSLTSTGIATITNNGNAETTLVRTDGNIYTDAPHVTRARIRSIRTRVMDLIPRNTHIVAIEGRSFGHNQSGTDQRVHLAYLIADACDHLGLPTVQVPPSTLKKWICDNGNANKAQVLDATTRMWPHTHIPNDDAADGLCLATLTRQHLGLPVPYLVLERHKLALAKIDWPQLAADGDTLTAVPVVSSEQDRLRGATR
jgi:crossover junction endodeoxyribonuclease RuvC